MTTPDPNIILTGFMGTGKTSVGRILSERTGRKFVDTDELIVEKTGLPIAEIFSQEGEEAFRELETSVTQELAGSHNMVISTGGRLMLDPLNALMLGRNGIIICLSAQPGDILARLDDDMILRPLLDVPDPEQQIRQLLDEREAAYAQFHRLDTTGKDISQVAHSVQELVDQLVLESGWPVDLVSQFEVRHPSGSYQISVGRNLLARFERFCPVSGSVAIITDSNIGPLHAHKLEDLNRATTVEIPAGEGYKNLETVRQIYPHLIEAGLDRHSTVVALGGGVVGDISGFVAASYLRGIDFVQCPTTLLSMVDASVGGKTGVDLPEGKNLVGVFKQPLAVVADLDTLETLPEVDFAAGLAEVVKHGLIASPGLIERISSWQLSENSARDENLQALIVEAIMIKRNIVEADPFEAGRRKVLNLGHTMGHAIEHVSEYHFRHGEAVAIGLVGAIKLSIALGCCRPGLDQQIEELLQSLNLPIRFPADLSLEAITTVMGRDKKKSGNKLQFILIRDIGDVFITDDVPEALVLQTLKELRNS
jgi:shikimate kinase/3-dehydroquinate synthase